MVLAPSHDPSLFMWLAVRVLGLVAVVATLLFSARLVRRSQWRGLRLAAFVGVGVLGGAILVAAMAAPPDQSGEGGPEWVIVLGGLALAAVWGVLIAGAVAGCWLQRLAEARKHTGHTG